MLNLPMLALALAAQPGGTDGPGTLCTNLARITVVRGERFDVEGAPGRRAYMVSAQTDRFWGVREVTSRDIAAFKAGPLLLERDGVRVLRLMQGRIFRGYVASDKSGRINHFHGPVLRGSALDRHFFNRVDFGPRGRAACNRSQ